MTILELMQQIRAGYPANWTHEQRGAYLNEVAWSLNQTGFPSVGLLHKPAGNNCPIPSGVLCSCDYLVERGSMNGYDVLVNETEPVWGGWDHPSDNFSGSPERWVAAVLPGTAPPTPDPVPEPPPPANLLEPRVAALETLLDEIVKQIGSINEGFEGLTDRHAALFNDYLYHQHSVKLGPFRARTSDPIEE